MRRLTRLALAAGLALGGGAAASTPAQAAACSGTTGVTVVVTYPGGSTVTRCAPGDPSSGAAALAAAGFSVTRVQQFPGALCRIDGQPSADPCQRMPPASAYWSYWHASRGGSWSSSNLGFDSYDPAPGSVEGWSFGSGGAPAVAPPAASSPPKTTTTSPRPRTSTTSPKPQTSTTSPKPRTSTTSPKPRTSTSRPVVVVTEGGRTTTLPAASGSPTTSRGPSATTTGRAATSSTVATTGSTTAAASSTEAAVATGAEAEPTATPWSLVAGLLAISALAVTAFAARRRRATH